MIIHIIVSTLVVPPNVNPYNKCIWTRAYYLLQDIEHRNDKPHVFCVTIIWWNLEADDHIYYAEHAERNDLTPVITFDQPLLKVDRYDA